MMAAGAPIKDPAFIQEALRALAASEEEFPIKVEGTKTLPYTATLLRVQAGGRLLLKLLRPLPPALASGALFEMVFATQDKRYEGRIRFEERDGYLQYRFQGPTTLMGSDRRLWKRSPIRPRENFYVTAQDSEMPGHGLTGPLINLSTGGLAFRLDRMVRLDDGMPRPPHAALFDKGYPLSFLRISGFPKGDVLETRGQVVRTQEVHSDLHLGIKFQGMGEAEKLFLAHFLETRDRQSGLSSGGFREGTGAIEWPSGAPAQAPRTKEAPAPPPAVVPDPAIAGLDALRTMDRRSLRILVVSPSGKDRDCIARNLNTAGFGRFETTAVLAEALALRQQEGAPPIRALLMDLEPSRADGTDPMAAARKLEPELKAFGDLPVFFVTRVQDPMLGLLKQPTFRALAQEGNGEGWAAAMGALVGV